MKKKFAETHEWIDVKDDTGTIGISNYAQKELGDIVFIELPQVGKQVKAGQLAAVLESTKAAADVYAPVSGIIVEVNGALLTTPELVNQSSESEGWLFKIKLENQKELDNLADQADYQKKFS